LPFRVFGSAAWRSAFPPKGLPLGVRCSFRVSARRSTARIGWAIPLCRWPFPRLCGFSSTGPRTTVKQSHEPLCEFRSPPEYYPADPSRPAAAAGSSHGLCFPSALKDSKVHLPRVCRARYVPPAGFGYPLGGLLPSSPCRSCFVPAALLGFALRSFLLSRGIHVSPHGRTHMPFLLPLLPSPKATGRPGRPRLLGFDPSESPWRPTRD
jgi:hypothetical protein